MGECSNQEKSRDKILNCLVHEREVALQDHRECIRVQDHQT